MTPSARLQAALELTAEIKSQNSPADPVIDVYFRKRRYAGSSDRRTVRDIVYKILRHQARLYWWIERTGLKINDLNRAHLIASLVLLDKLSPEELTALFSGRTHAPATITDDETQLADALYGRPINHMDMKRYTRFEYPQWMDLSFASLWGDEIITELSALNQKAPVDVRINTTKATREQALDALTKEFVEAEPTALSPLGLRLAGNPKLGGTQTFKNGWIEVQDEGSQLVSLLCGTEPGMNVVDFCAGAGGKTLALAAMMTVNNKIRGQLTACDISDFRLARMKPRLKRAGIKGVRQQVITAKDCPWINGNQASADRVLVDAPCTGTGVWRRDPTARWRFSFDDLNDILQSQCQILDAAATVVKPGGRLIFVTCSLLVEENEQQIEQFQNRHGNFKILPIDQVWNETIGDPAPPPAPFMRLSPASTGTDGFFAAVLTRQT